VRIIRILPRLLISYFLIKTIQSMQYVLKTLLVLACLLPIALQAQEIKVKEVKVNVEEENGHKKIIIEQVGADGAVEVIEWEGTGAIPEEIIQAMPTREAAVFIKAEQAGADQKMIKVIVERLDTVSTVEEGGAIKVIVHKEGEEVLHLDDEAEVIVLREDEAMDEKPMKVWVEKAGDGEEKEIQVRVEAAPGQKVKEEKIVVVEMVSEHEKKIMVRDAATAPKAPGVKLTLQLETLDIELNPEGDQMNLQFTTASGPVSVRVFDAAGQDLYREFRRTFDGNYQHALPLGALSGDFIYLSIEQGDKVFTEKISLR